MFTEKKYFHNFIFRPTHLKGPQVQLLPEINKLRDPSQIFRHVASNSSAPVAINPKIPFKGKGKSLKINPFCQ